MSNKKQETVTYQIEEIAQTIAQPEDVVRAVLAQCGFSIDGQSVSGIVNFNGVSADALGMILKILEWFPSLEHFLSNAPTTAGRTSQPASSISTEIRQIPQLEEVQQRLIESESYQHHAFFASGLEAGGAIADTFHAGWQIGFVSRLADYQLGNGNTVPTQLKQITGRGTQSLLPFLSSRKENPQLKQGIGLLPIS